MAVIRRLRGFTPKIGTNCFIAENATIIGDVIIGDECSIWFNAVVRGDVNSITIGNRVNVQDGAVLHCTFEKTVIEIGNNVTIGHNAIVHGAKVGDNVLIGMGAILMDDVMVGSNSIIAAGAVLLEGTVVEPGSVYGGVPSKLLKRLDIGLAGKAIGARAENYLRYSSWYLPENGYGEP